MQEKEPMITVQNHRIRNEKKIQLCGSLQR